MESFDHLEIRKVDHSCRHCTLLEEESVRRNVVIYYLRSSKIERKSTCRNHHRLKVNWLCAVAEDCCWVIQNVGGGPIKLSEFFVHDFLHIAVERILIKA